MSSPARVSVSTILMADTAASGGQPSPHAETFASASSGSPAGSALVIDLCSSDDEVAAPRAAGSSPLDAAHPAAGPITPGRTVKDEAAGEASTATTGIAARFAQQQRRLQQPRRERLDHTEREEQHGQVPQQPRRRQPQQQWRREASEVASPATSDDTPLPRRGQPGTLPQLWAARAAGNGAKQQAAQALHGAAAESSAAPPITPEKSRERGLRLGRSSSTAAAAGPAASTPRPKRRCVGRTPQDWQHQPGQPPSRHEPQKWLIELYAGSQEVTMYAADQLGIPTANCLTVDYDPRTHPKVIANLAEYDEDAVRGFKVRYGIANEDAVVLWASPPCEQYSPLGRCRRPGPPDFEKADKCVAAVFAFIRVLHPIRFFIENPATGVLAERRVLLDGLDAVAPDWERYEVSYCQYGCSMRKQTYIWTNCELSHFEPMVCDPDTCPAMLSGRRRHADDIIGKPSTWSARIPFQLTLALTAGVVAEVQDALRSAASPSSAMTRRSQAGQQPNDQSGGIAAGANRSARQDTLLKDVAMRRAFLQEAMTLSDHTEEARKMQRQWAARLAGLLKPGNIVALRHSDTSFTEYSYYLTRVTKGLRRLGADETDDFEVTYDAGSLVFEGTYFELLESDDGETDTSHTRWVSAAGDGTALLSPDSIIIAGLQLQEFGHGISCHFRQASSQHRRILRMLENIGPGEADDSGSDGAEAGAGAGGASGGSGGGSGSDGGVEGGGGSSGGGSASARLGSAVHGVGYESDDMAYWSA